MRVGFRRACSLNKRTSTNDWLVEGFSTHELKVGIGPTPPRQRTRLSREDCEAAFSYIGAVDAGHLLLENILVCPLGSGRCADFPACKLTPHKLMGVNVFAEPLHLPYSLQ